MNDTIWICVYRDTIEDHDETENLADVQVAKEFVKQYVGERQKGVFDNTEEFLNEYTADNTMDFYSYATEHGAVIAVENW